MMHISVVCNDEPKDIVPKGANKQKPASDASHAEEIPGSVDLPILLKDAEAAKMEASTKDGYLTGSQVMDEILEHSQQRMLDAIEAVGRRVDVLAETAHHGSAPTRPDSGVPTVLDPVVG